MPELPEVETIVRSLQAPPLSAVGIGEDGRGFAGLPGRTLQGAQILWPRTLALPDAASFAARLPGQTVRAVGRRGKFILIHLDADTLLIHLRMSGDLRFETQYDPQRQQPHDRLLFYFADQTRLAFNDARKFGRVWLAADPAQVVGGLGPEPLEDDFTPQVLFARLRAHRRQIKPLLLDQSFLAGLGNIYTDESLHLARIHPLSIANTLTEEQAARLWAAIRSVLQEGIRRNGASIDWVYRGGSFQNNFRVYQRDGQPCLVCGATIQRCLVGQRGTHFCPVCQE